MCREICPSNEFNDFISSHLNFNPADVLIKYSGENLNIDLKYAVMQIECRKKTRKKLPFFLNFRDFRFPDSLSAEQASDEKVAQFHADLIGIGKRVVDLTSGLGIDSMTIAKGGNEVIAIELDKNKADTLLHNFRALNLNGIKVINGDCREVLKSLPNTVDYFFIDPARRDENKKRTYSFKDCLPDITSFYKKLIADGATLFIKASPLLDISAVIKELDKVKAIYAVAVKGECKEILIEISNAPEKRVKKLAIDIWDDKRVIFELQNEEVSLSPIYNLDCFTGKEYLYEPNAAVMKLKAADNICAKYDEMKKVGPNTELFLSKCFYPTFPGRIIRLEKILSSKDLKSLRGKGYSVAVRNYPLSAEELRKKLKVKEDRENFIYGMRIGKGNKPIIVEGKKIEG